MEQALRIGLRQAYPPKGDEVSPVRSLRGSEKTFLILASKSSAPPVVTSALRT
jgi:hypothetical protein